MELRHLRYFIAAAEEEHFGRAAERLHVTRPAVSQIVADLESELGILLFERLAHRIKLTAAGRTLLPQLQNLMADLKQAFVLAKRVGEGKAGALTVGYGTLTLLHPIFRAAVKRFHDEYPEVTLSLVEIATSEQPKALSEGKIHAGFIHLGPRTALPGRKRSKGAEEETVLEHFKIQSGGLGVVVPKDHPLARKRSVALPELAREQFVVVPHSIVTPSYGWLFALCQKNGFEPKVAQEVGSVNTLLNLVSVGMGIGLTLTGKDINYPPSLAVVKLDKVSYTTSFNLAWVKGPAEPVLDRFIRVVRDLAGERT
jgi:DNA-binding transcriptional LysR family regulator